MARNLELALRKRSDSEPPDFSSLRSLNMSYKAKRGVVQLTGDFCHSQGEIGRGARGMGREEGRGGEGRREGGREGGVNFFFLGGGGGGGALST